MNKKIYFTMDVEEWFHAQNILPFISDRNFNKYSSLDKVYEILDFLETRSVKGTFFLLGETAKKNPKLVKKLINNKHEVASHGLNHTLIKNLSYQDLALDIKTSKDIIEDISGEKIMGYRSPCFGKNIHLNEILCEMGFVYTSNIISASFHDRYSQKIDTKNTENNIFDYNLPIINILNFSIPCTGGGWFRLFPSFLQKVLFYFSQNNEIIFYCHPWDFDSNQPLNNYEIPMLNKLRHTIGNKSSLSKLSKFKFHDYRLRDKFLN